MSDIELQVNGKEIPLNEQMQDMLENILLGYLSSASEIPDPITSINVNIKRWKHLADS